jgi:hypothetical protein
MTKHDTLTAKELKALLRHFFSGEKDYKAALEFCKGKTLNEAWSTCKRPGWMRCFILALYTRLDHPTAEDLAIDIGNLGVAFSDTKINPAQCDLIREIVSYIPVDRKHPDFKKWTT